MSVKKQIPNSFSFEFPTLISDNAAFQNDVVFFCGKLIEPGLEEEDSLFIARSKSFSKPRPVRCTDRDKRWGSCQLPATGYSRLQRSGSSRRYASGLFGAVKFPVQMELSDMKKRQSARLTKVTTATASDGDSEEKGEKSGWKWQLIRTLRRKGRQWLNALSTSSFDF